MSTTNGMTLIGLLVIMVGLSGCAATGLDRAPQDMSNIDPDKAIVIFSVLAAESVEEQSLELSWMGISGKIQFGNVKQKPSSNPLRIYAVEIPGDRLVLKTMKINIGGEWWQTTGQKELELVTGQVTYIGRIKIQDIRFVEVLEGGFFTRPSKRKKVLRPYSVKLGFSDHSESDLKFLRTEYDLMDGQTITSQIPQKWGTGSHLTLVPASSSGIGGTLLEILNGLS